MKVFIAGLITETNTFSPLPTGHRNYAETSLFHGKATSHPPRWASGILHRWRSLAETRRYQVVESLFAMAQPAGPTVRAVYEALRDEILADLEAALPVDVVLLALHGAMVAEGCDDCEGEILEQVRNRVGAGTPIGVELDLHCHITEQMVSNASAIVTYKEYPHTDTAERAEELFDICRRMLESGIKPVISVYDCRMINIWPTGGEPMRGFVRRMKEFESKNGILSVSLGHGFPWGDVADLGAKVLVVTDDAPELGAAVAEELDRELWSIRDRTHFPQVSLPEAFDCIEKTAEGPIVLADFADNPGGGAAGDSTFLLAEALRRGLRDGALSSIWDPMAVRICFDAGQGAELPLRIGGKTGPASGSPLDVSVKVVKLIANATQSLSGALIRMGDAVRVSCCGIDVILNSIRTQTMAPDAFTNFGIDPGARRFLIVKSMHHFHAGFAPLSKAILYVATPGALSLDLVKIAYRKASRKLWPRDPDPFSEREQ